METCKLTEPECIDLLIAGSKELGEKAPRVVVVNRMQKPRSMTRTVRFALIITTNNIALIEALIRKCLEKDDEFYFVGSEVNLQKDLEMDYVYFEAKIMTINQ